APRQSILLGIFVGIASGALAYAAGPWLLKVMGGKGEALRLGLVYLNIILIANVPYFLMYIFSGIYRGLGDMRTPLIIMMVTTVIALLGDYLLIFGIGPFPRLGVAGAGMA
ncbi:MAG TPA: MATE family efflux transporter, partial [Armatimonadetes bacterium]|nr:MATE family efflux transporter [Armatimonadota bacterium]